MAGNSNEHKSFPPCDQSPSSTKGVVIIGWQAAIEVNQKWSTNEISVRTTKSYNCIARSALRDLNIWGMLGAWNFVITGSTRGLRKVLRYCQTARGGGRFAQNVMKKSWLIERKRTRRNERNRNSFIFSVVLFDVSCLLSNTTALTRFLMPLCSTK